MTYDEERLTRTGRWAPLMPTDHHEVAERNRQHDREALERGLQYPPMGWPEIAAWVDESVWTRLLSEYRDTQPAEYQRMVAIRPPKHQRLGDGP